MKILLGEILVKKGVVSKEQMEEALAIQKNEGGLLGIILVSQGVISEQTLVEYLALQAKMVIDSE